jgi:hypothetical protein
MHPEHVRTWVQSVNEPVPVVTPGVVRGSSFDSKPYFVLLDWIVVGRRGAGRGAAAGPAPARPELRCCGASLQSVVFGARQRTKMRAQVRMNVVWMSRKTFEAANR